MMGELNGIDHTWSFDKQNEQINILVIERIRGQFKRDIIELPCDYLILVVVYEMGELIMGGSGSGSEEELFTD